jgi:uncharacterized protein (UPF0216 family)
MIGHMMVGCPRFVEMKNLLKDKASKLINNQPLANKKTLTSLVNMVVVVIHNKRNEEHVFKDWELLKNKNVVDYNEKEKLKKSFVETI